MQASLLVSSETFSSPKKEAPYLLRNHSPSLPRQPPGCCRSLWIYLCRTFQGNGITTGDVCIWLISLSMFLSLIHVVACIRNPFFVMAQYKYYAMMETHYILFILPPVDGHLCCFHLLATSNSAAMNIHG